MKSKGGHTSQKEIKARGWAVDAFKSRPGNPPQAAIRNAHGRPHRRGSAGLSIHDLGWRSQFASEPTSRFSGFHRINKIDDDLMNHVAGGAFERPDVKARWARS